jgi:hypothetical protein
LIDLVHLYRLLDLAHPLDLAHLEDQLDPLDLAHLYHPLNQLDPLDLAHLYRPLDQLDPLDPLDLELGNSTEDREQTAAAVCLAVVAAAVVGP